MSENLTPRLYQLEIVELAKKSNVVAYLDTGSGKTFIAVLLLRHRQEAAAAAHAAALAAATPPPPPWKAIFLAPQVALVEQQAAVLSRHLPARVRKLVGADIESWTGHSYILNWRQSLAELDVLVATPQLVVDMLRHAVVPGLWMFDTIVFDEAHHCKGGHPYNRIMECYKQPLPRRLANAAASGNEARNPTTGMNSFTPSSSSSYSLSKPRIFGMSAAPAGAGAAKSHLLPKNLAVLELNMESQVVTVADRSMVNAVVPQPELEIEEYQCGEAMIEAIPNLTALRQGIQRALARLDVAVTLEQLRWTASLQGTVGLSGASDVTYCTFDPGAPKFKISRLKDIFRSILHVLQQVGAYGAVRSTLHAFQWLAKGAPDARQSTYTFPSTSTYNSINKAGSAAARPRAASGTGDEAISLQDLGFGDDTIGPSSFIATDIEYRLADLRRKASVENVTWSEAEDLGIAAVLSTVEVLKSFLAAFGEVLVDQNVAYALSILEEAYGDIKSGGTGRNSDGPTKSGTRMNGAGGKGHPFSLSLGNAPIFIMQRIIDLITPQDLGQSLDFILSSTGRSSITACRALGAEGACSLLRFEFPLISPKAAKLVEILQRYSPLQPSPAPENSVSEAAEASVPRFQNIFSTYWSGIVFAQQRTTVLALSALLAHLPTAHSWLKSSPFMAQGVALGGCAFMPDEQKAILDSFRAGKLNLLVSTSVAEEGIDVKSCQLVIRFDPAPTAQAFHQSRGRARAAGSQLIALVEHGNVEEHAAVHEMAAYQHKMREAALQNVADLVQAENINLDELDDHDDGKILEDDLYGNSDINSITESNRAYIVPSTGAKVDLYSAGSVLQHYICQLPADEYMLLRPAWRVDYIEGGSTIRSGVTNGVHSTSSAVFGGPPSAGSYQVRATVRLPSSSPVQLATGQLVVSKRMAKASAALEACRELHRLGALNDHLLPAGLVPDDNEEEDVDLLPGGEEGDAGATGIGKRRRAGTIFASINIKTTPPAGLSTPLPRSIEPPGVTTVTVYGYGWKERRRRGSTEANGTWFPLLLLLPKFIDISCCSNGDGGGGKKAGQWGDAVHLGEFQLDEAQLRLVLQCDDYLKTASGPWHSLSLSISSISGGENSNGSPYPPASTYALAPLLVESGTTCNTPQQLDWAKLQRIVWLQDASRSRLSVLDIMRTQDDGTSNNTSTNQQNILNDSVLITKYNYMVYEFLNVSSTMTLSSKFPQDRHIQNNGTGARIGNHTSTKHSKADKTRGGDIDALLDDNATFSDFYAQRWNENNLHQEQPLLQAARAGSSSMARRHTHQQHVSTISTLIEEREDGEIEKEPVFLVPQLCTLHPIPSSLWPALTAVPRLLWDIEGGFHAFELVTELQNAGFPAQVCPPLYLIKQALTAPSASIDAKDEGNYETLEALGDGLLKFAASTQLFLNNPVWHEGQLTGAKDRMVSNKKLIKVALTLGLEKRVRLTGWRVKERKKRKINSPRGTVCVVDDGVGDIELKDARGGELENGELHNDDEEEDVAPAAAAAAVLESAENDAGEEEGRSTRRNGKLLADAMEALIGAFYVGGGIEAGLAFLRHVQLADCPIEKLIQYSSSMSAPGTAPALHGGGSNLFNTSNQKSNAFFPIYLSSSSSLHSLDISQVEAALGGYKFQNPALAQEALTHGSVLGERCYQRLEFLGDCILDLILLKTAYCAYKRDVSPAQLHDIRSITVNAERLALAAVRANLHTHILYHSAALFNQIDEFVVEAESAVKRAGKEAAGMVYTPSLSTSQFAWDDVMVRYGFGLDRICAPKVLSDIIEALMGAVWLDSQGDWEVAAAVAKHLLSPLPWIDEVAVDGRQPRIPPHPVRRIHELAAKVGVTVDFQVVRDVSNNSISSVNTMAVRVMFGDRCLGQGPPSGGNKAAAARLAAQAVLIAKSEEDILSLFMKHGDRVLGNFFM